MKTAEMVREELEKAERRLGVYNSITLTKHCKNEVLQLCITADGGKLTAWKDSNFKVVKMYFAKEVKLSNGFGPIKAKQRTINSMTMEDYVYDMIMRHGWDLV